MTPSSRKIAVVIPYHNEASHLESSLDAICRELDALPHEYELILIDDGSTDATWEAISRCRKRRSNIRALQLSRRFGKDLALCAGLEHARADAVIVMDGDLQHPPAVIPAMVKSWDEEGYDVVEAVKADRSEDSPHARIRARLFYFLFRRLSGLNLANASDFKLLDKRVLSAWTSLKERDVFFRGMSAWLGFKRKEISIDIGKRAGGKSSWTGLNLLVLAVTGITSFSSIPLHITTLIGGVFLVFSFTLGSFALLKKITGQAVTGFTTVIILQLMIGSLLMIALGIIGTYISKIYNEVKRRPRYIISDVIEPAE